MEQKDSSKHPALADGKMSWEPSAGIRVPPLFVPSAEGEKRQPLSRGMLENKWVIMQTFHSEQNRELLTSLENGLESVEISADDGELNLQELLESVYPNMVEIHFSASLNGLQKEKVVLDFIDWLKKGNWKPDECRGSFRFRADAESERLFQQYSSRLTGFTWFFFESHGEIPREDKVAQLVSIFTQLLKFFANSAVVPNCTILKKSTFRLSAGNDFITEIAKIRAFFLIWNLVLSKLGCDEFSPDLEITIDPLSYEENIFHNLIRTTTSVTSALIAGAGRMHLPVFPGSFTGQLNDPIGFIRRMNINVSHILRHESQLDKVVDPVSGSYMIESLSEKFAQTAWNRIREKV
ncbi:MAG: hypothetical protein EA409_00700 [Saprospirales bacterium]|nr:MAG: hypothetical protein EA409_00700 [Saprospirales bacterium]